MTDEPKSVHTPVLCSEVEELIRRGWQQRGESFPAGGLIVDVTLGAAGHASRLLEAFDCRLLGIDQDPEILALAEERLAPYGKRATLRRARMSDLCGILHEERREGRMRRPAAILMDLGASSLQLDSAERGFSFLHDGPLDMRMDPTRERTAADIVNHWDESDLADLFYHEGDEKRSRPIARAIVEERRRAPFLRTAGLADTIARAVGGAKGKIHPATRAFQALRRAVNEEGEELLTALDVAEYWMADGGVLVAISFHSGEDRVVKRYLADGAKRGRWSPLTKKPVTASREELAANRRARSAKVRASTRVRGGGLEAGCKELLS